MSRLPLLAALLLPAELLADNLWLEAAGSAHGQRVGVTRTLANFGLDNTVAGLAHHRYGDAWWSLVEAGHTRRFGKTFIASSKLQFGPGQMAGENFSYRKLALSGTWLWSQRWSTEISDTYVNVGSTIGHVVGASLTRSEPAGYSVTASGLASLGSAIDTQLLGLSFRLQRGPTWIGGVYGGRTSDPTRAGELGVDAAGGARQLRQIYAGISIPAGRFELLGVLDYLRLGSADRYELSVVLRVPLGTRREARP